MFHNLVLLLNLQAPTPIHELLENSGYSCLRDSYEDSQQEDYLHSQRKIRLEIVSQGIPPSETVGTLLRKVDRWSAGKLTGEVFLPPSRMPLGRDLRFMNGAASSLVFAVAENAFITVRLKTAYERERGVSKPLAPLGGEDWALQESVTRWVLALKTSRAYQAGRVSVGGRDFNSRRNGTNIHIDASAWAQSHNFPYRLNRDSACAVISHPTGLVTLALGAPSVKVGSEWQAISDVVLCDGEKILIPKSIIDRL